MIGHDLKPLRIKSIALDHTFIMQISRLPDNFQKAYFLPFFFVLFCFIKECFYEVISEGWLFRTKVKACTPVLLTIRLAIGCALLFNKLENLFAMS